MFAPQAPAFPGGGGLSFWDLPIVVLCLGAAGAAAWRRAGAEEPGVEEFLTAGRRLPWTWAAAGTVSSEISSLTILGIPAAAYAGGWGYLEFFVGSVLARAVFARVFVPAYFHSGAATPYEFLGRRLGPLSRRTSALLFLALQLVASSVRLAAAGAAAAWMLGWPVWTTVLLMAGLGLFCAAASGLSGAVRSGAVQAAVVILAGLGVAVYAATRVDGGFEAAWICAQSAGRLDVFTGAGSMLAAALLGFVSTLAAFCCDFELGQKILCAADEEEAQRAVWAGTAASFFVLCVFLAAGSALFSFYKLNTGFAAAARPEQLWPQFAVSALPAGLRGLALAAVLVASCDLPLISMAAVVSGDLGGMIPDVRTLRLAMGAAACVLAAAAVSLAGHGLWVAVQFGGAVLGPLLGATFLAWKRRRAGGDLPAASALAAMAAADAVILWFGRKGLPFDWSWLVVFGAAGCAALGWSSGRLLERKRRTS